jgi:acetolactate synthase-1/3 small subunit
LIGHWIQQVPAMVASTAASRASGAALVLGRTVSKNFIRASSSSSTSALTYKALHRRVKPLPTTDTPAWSASAAVSSILYETPLPSADSPKNHILNCLVQNEPGVLSRVSGILAARGFNIDSLVVCNTEAPDLSRMTIVLSGQDGVVEQARRQLEDLVPAWAVLDYTSSPLVQRELLLAKVSILGPEYFEELFAQHREISAEGELEEIESGTGKDFHPLKLPQSQALRHKHEHLRAITDLTHQFGGKVSDISDNCCIVELYGCYILPFKHIFIDYAKIVWSGPFRSAKPSRINAFLKLISSFGILESARTGNKLIALT